MTLAKAKARTRKRRSRFVVGYVGAGNCLYSSTRAFTCVESATWATKGGIDPMTRKQADRLLAQMPCAGCAVFELVPVGVNR